MPDPNDPGSYHSGGMGPLTEIGLWMGSDIASTWGSSGINYMTGIRGAGGRFTTNPFTTSRHMPGPWRQFRDKFRIWDRSREGVTRRAKARAFRAFQSSVGRTASEAALRAQGRGAAAMGEAALSNLTGRATAQGFAPSLFGKKLTGKAAGVAMGVGMLGRVVSRGFGAMFAVDITKMMVGGAVDAMIEMGRPRDVQPRFFDSPMNMTMRQSALMAIHQSQLQTRSALSREALFMHQ